MNEQKQGELWEQGPDVPTPTPKRDGRGVRKGVDRFGDKRGISPGRKAYPRLVTPEEFKALMDDTGMKAETLAEIVGRSHITLSQYRMGMGTPPGIVIEKLKAIADWVHGRIDPENYTAICMNYIKVHKL